MSLIYFVFLFFSAQLVWRLVLKKDAYPSSIPQSIKIAHAVIIMIVSFSAFCDVNSMVSIILRHPLTEVYSPEVNLMTIVAGSSATYLLFICSAMARRQRGSLLKYYILWPITYACSTYVAVVREANHIRAEHLVVGVTLITIAFLFTLFFYLFAGAKRLFGN
jgi:hypothetical protein